MDWYETQLKQRGYGTQTEDGEVLNIDNSYRKETATDADRLRPAKEYWQNGFRVPLEAFYQGQDRTAFSPLPSNPASIEGAFLGVLLLKLMRDNPAAFERIAVKYLDSCARIVESVEDSCHTHWLTALNNQHISAGIAHKIGLLDDGSYLKIIEHYRHVFDSLYEKGVADQGLQVFVQGARAISGTN